MFISSQDIDKIVHFESAGPADILGPKIISDVAQKGLAIHAYLPRAKKAFVHMLDKKTKFEMTRVHPQGLFESFLPGILQKPMYRLEAVDETGHSQIGEDPYAFSPELTDFDLYLMGEGTHFRSYEKMGARPWVRDGIAGVHFSVWAPNAMAVAVAGNFNHWFEGSHPMTQRGVSGVWEIFIPGLKEGEVYKYAIKSNKDKTVHLKTDPYAFAAELRPHTASVVTLLDKYVWRDQDWMAHRKQMPWLQKPISVYEVHLPSWRKNQGRSPGFLSYAELAAQLIPYVKAMGYTHIELLPIMEHPLDASWGYQVVNYYAPSSRHGQPADLMKFIDTCHQNGIGVFMDWVPAHFPKDEHGLAMFDGTHLYSHLDPRRREHPEWGTQIFNYGRNEVRNFLISNALFWLDKYHADGLRVDAVASMLYLDYSRKQGEWTPNSYGGRENLDAVAFMKKFNEVVHAQFPGVLTIAEESTSWPGVSRPTYVGGLGFSMKWDMGWMHDQLEYFQKDPLYRKYHHNLLTFRMLYAFGENFMLPISHDEVVHGKQSMVEKMPGDLWQKFANLRLFYGLMFAHPGKKLLFMTNDIGQYHEWDAMGALDWGVLDFPLNRGLNHYIHDLNVLYRNCAELHEMDFSSEGFQWIDFQDTDSSVISFMRFSKDGKNHLVFVCNFTPVPRHAYGVGVPSAGWYKEIFNSDATEYGGSGLGNLGGVQSEPLSWHGRPFSLALTLPPLAFLVFASPR